MPLEVFILGISFSLLQYFIPMRAAKYSNMQRQTQRQQSVNILLQYSQRLNHVSKSQWHWIFFQPCDDIFMLRE